MAAETFVDTGGLEYESKTSMRKLNIQAEEFQL